MNSEKCNSMFPTNSKWLDSKWLSKKDIFTTLEHIKTTIVIESSVGMDSVIRFSLLWKTIWKRVFTDLRTIEAIGIISYFDLQFVICDLFTAEWQKVHTCIKFKSYFMLIWSRVRMLWRPQGLNLMNLFFSKSWWYELLLIEKRYSVNCETFGLENLTIN